VGGWHDHGTLRAAAELALTNDACEIALTVEAPWRRRGVGRALLLRGIDHAATCGARRLVMHLAQENGAMVALARACGAQMAADRPDISGPTSQA
jgi:GNAT superfamily N-acetyltransferase